jgi:lambda family phage tail tape measure protein
VADEIGRGVIVLSIDGKEVASGIADVKRKLTDLEQTATKSAGATKAAFEGSGTAVQGATDKMNAATKRWITSIEREIVALGGSREEVRLWEASVKKIPQTVYQPLVAKLAEAKIATDELAAAQRRAASEDAFLQSLQKQSAALGKTTADLQRMEAARLGVSARAEPLIAAGESARSAQASQAFIQDLQNRSAAIGKTQADLLEMKAIQMGINQSVYGPHIAALRAQEQGLHRVGITAKQTQQAMRLLPAQITDIVTSIASGMPLYLIAIQQGGQIKDSFGGIGNAARQMGIYIRDLFAALSPVTVAMGALAAISATVVAGFAMAEKEAKAFNVALINSGGYAGTSAVAFTLMAERISQIGVTQGAASAALVLLASTGRVTNGIIEQLATSALSMSRVTGRAVKEIVAEYVELSKAPYEASLRLNEQYNYLTASVLEQIDALIKQGREMEASQLAMTTYADTVASRSGEILANLGSFERGWIAIKNAIGSAIDALKDFGRQTTTPAEQALVGAMNALESARLAGLAGGGGGGDLDALQFEVDRLRMAVEEEKKITAERQRQQEAQKKGVEYQEEFIKLQKDLMSLERNKERRITEEIARRKQLIGPDLWKDEYAAQIRELMDPPSKAKGKEYRNDAATAMILELRQRSFVLAQQEEEIGNEQKLGAERKKQIEFEILIADLQEKGRLTNSEKELLAAKDVIKFFLDANAAQEEKNELKEKELALMKLIEQSSQRDLERQEKLVATIREYALGLKQAQDDTNRNYGRERDEFTSSDRSKRRTTGRQQIEDRYRGESERRIDDYIANKIDADQLKFFLEMIKGYQDEALKGWEEHYDALTEMESERINGAAKALNNFVDESLALAARSEEVWTKAFSSIGDAIAEFTKTGKLDFKSMVASFIADIVRINTNAFFATILRSAFGAAGTASAPSNLAGTAGGDQSAFINVPRMATGTNYVPYDGFRAVLHEGEAVIPKAFNPAAGGKAVKSDSYNITVNLQAPVEPMSEWRLQQAIREGAVSAVREKQLRSTGSM